MEIVLKLLEKISSYQVLNYLIPGSIMCVLLKWVAGIDLLSFSTIENVIICYFLGMVNGRIASLVLFPLLNNVGVVKEAPYEQYVEAEKVDSKVQVLSDVNVLFRSLANAMLLILLAYGLEKIIGRCMWLMNNINWLTIIGLFVLFLFSIKKQTEFVTKRINETNKRSSMKKRK